jgi:hypothetical protein
MLMFFNTHQCNEHCQKLGLLNPRLTDKVPDNFTLIATRSEEETSMPGNTRVHKLCDLCRKAFETTFAHYVEKRNKGFELWCNPCSQKRDETMKSAQCEKCRATFKSSAYWFLRKKTDFPTLCSACRLERRERMRTALEGGGNVAAAQVTQPSRFALPKSSSKEQESFHLLIGELEKNFPLLLSVSDEKKDDKMK